MISSPEAAGEAFFYLSSIAEREGRTDLALEGYSRLAEAGAGLIVRGRAARLLMKKDDRDAAFRLLDEHAAKERSEALDVEFAKAALLEETGKPSEAIAMLQLALERYPESPRRALPDRADPGQGGARRASRCAASRSLLKDRPEDASLLNALGYSLADRNQKLPRAETLIRKALDASPDNPAFLDSLGWVRFRRGDIPGALPHLERAYRIFPDAEIASHWGELLWVSGKQAEARALWARSLARSPDSKPLRATIERLTGTKLDPVAPKPADARRREEAAPPEGTQPLRPPPARVVRDRRHGVRVARAALGAAALAVLLAGCRTVPLPPRFQVPAPTRPGPSNAPGSKNSIATSLTGRVAVAANGQGFSGTLAISAATGPFRPGARRAAGHRWHAGGARGRRPADRDQPRRNARWRRGARRARAAPRLRAAARGAALVVARHSRAG